jgi:hypothetical protein
MVSAERARGDNFDETNGSPVFHVSIVTETPPQPQVGSLGGQFLPLAAQP